MIIQHKEVGGKGFFYLNAEGETLAELIYTKPGENKIIIEHTEVDERLSGKGVGLQLVRHAVEFARMGKLKIIPLCPFAKSVFDKKAEFRDVLV